MTLRTGQNRHAYLGVIANLAKKSTEAQDRLLRAIGEQIACVEVRLLDPSSFKLRSATQRRKAATISLKPIASREARLDAALRRADSEAFAVANDELVTNLRSDIRLFQNPVRLSSRPVQTAKELIGNMQAVEAVRSTKDGDLIAKRLPRRVENEYYSGFDYEFDFKKKDV
jgi:hypothetical protein